MNQRPPAKKMVAPAAQAFAEELERAGQKELVVDLQVAQAAKAEVAADEPYAWDEGPAEMAGAPPVGGPPPGAPVPPPAAAPMRAYRQMNAPVAPPPSAQKALPMSSYAPSKTSEELQLEATGPRVVETGFWIWRNVIVPPNVYVVHTRRGRAEPVTLGLGKSFRFNPLTDSYLVVPAAMQTIGIFAKCISAEKQGIHVLAYVQWLISDFAIAYKRLDFSNTSDPMGIVNSQLREQAEAAIKDTVSTMTVEQVLTDKAPIIQELTERMKSVAEGRDGDGLGLKIVTVQIKEAVVASSALFENLQAPYRHEKSRVARLSEIETESQVQARAREAEIEREAADARAASEIARLRAQTELASAEASLAARTRHEELTQKAEQAEHAFRHETELATLRQAQARDLEARRLATAGEQEGIALQQQLALARATAEIAELEASERVNAERRAAEKAELEGRIAIDRTRHEARLRAEREAEEQRLALLEAANRVGHAAEIASADVDRIRQETANAKTPSAVQAELVATLPALAAHMPDIQEYRYVGVSDGKNGGPFNALPEFLAKAMGVANAFGWRFNGRDDAATEASLQPPAPPEG